MRCRSYADGAFDYSLIDIEEFGSNCYRSLRSQSTWRIFEKLSVASRSAAFGVSDGSSTKTLLPAADVGSKMILLCYSSSHCPCGCHKLLTTIRFRSAVLQMRRICSTIL